MTTAELTTQRKALRINLDKRMFGTFAEIGAGQEVVRHFFQAGGAAGTIAKTISAYDMTFSDEIYGKSGRYVSRERLVSMLDHEYNLLLQRLSGKRGHESLFFAFADTVAAMSFKGSSECHGWMGVRFQRNPLAPPNEIVMHVRMLDRSNVQQQEALGFVGVNLIYSAFFCENPAEDFVSSLLECLSNERIEIDMIEMSGPDFKHIDNRLISLQQVQLGLSNAALFAPCGRVLQPSEVLYNKAVLIERGSFRPVTHVHVDMLETARSTFQTNTLPKGKDCVTLAELTLNNLMSTGSIDMSDFLARVDTISSLGLNVLISNYPQFYLLISYLRRYTKEPIGLAMGVNTLLEVFNEKHYEKLEGGILESLGRLFRHRVQLLIYPMTNSAFQEYIKLFNPPFDGTKVHESALITAQNLPVLSHLTLLHSYLLEQGSIVELKNYNPELLKVLSRDILKRIATGDPTWEEVVPKPAAELIKHRKLLGYSSAKNETTQKGNTALVETEESGPTPLH